MDSFLAETEFEEVTPTKSTKKPLTPRKNNPTKKQKRDVQEDLLLEKAICVMEAAATNNTQLVSNDTRKNADDLFGEYIASELKTVSNEALKRDIKYHIQSIIHQQNLGDYSQTVQFPTYNSTYRMD